jgi:uncharacterized membrane protein required for colicin V production
MGLDLTLAGLVLLMAVRGWLRGFLVQAIRLCGLVASVYLADPVRDQAKPYALEYLPAIRPDLVDRILWWASAVTCYLVLVGVASLAVGVSRRRPYGLAEPDRSDQFAGFGLGVLKGLIVASFLVAGLQKYGQGSLARISWAADQTRESYAWMWNEQYHPAARVWHSQPVQQFVSHIQKMGLRPPSTSPAGPGETSATVRTASRTPNLLIPPGFPTDLDTSGLDPEMTRTIEAIQKALSQLEADK